MIEPLRLDTNTMADNPRFWIRLEGNTIQAVKRVENLSRGSKTFQEAEKDLNTLSRAFPRGLIVCRKGLEP